MKISLFKINKNTTNPLNIESGSDFAKDSKRAFSSFVLTIVSALITLPLFILVYRYVPDIIIPIGKGMRVDHVLTFVLIFTIIRLLVHFIQYFLYAALVVMIVVMTVGQIAGKFGFTHMYYAYVDLITYVGANNVDLPFFDTTKTNIKNGPQIRAAIDYENPVVRDFAVAASTKYFSKADYDYRFEKIVRYFSVFKVMSSWRYVDDPRGEDYYAKASESVKLMSGDCDDYAILMAACIKATGGTVRLVRTANHLYPEVRTGTMKDLPDLVSLIKRSLFLKESLGEKIYYHSDQWDNVWLNFDYTNIFPGGKFMSTDIVGIMEI
jgi:hypothetical protein